MKNAIEIFKKQRESNPELQKAYLQEKCNYEIAYKIRACNPTMTRYQETLTYLFSLTKSRGIDMGLERMRALVSALKIPIETIPVVHVGGTNGKGSVSTKIAAALQMSGFKTGLYTSPHISSFRERFVINGEMISEEKICEYVDRICSLHLNPTFFEIATLIMFLWAVDEKVDYLVLEVGLGGRLDATNVCYPVLTVITSIDFDHQDILGDTLEKIAREKAGIIKPGCPVVIGPSVPMIANAVVCPKVTDDYELENREIARRALSFLPVTNIEAALRVTPPCRYQICIVDGVTVIIDVAHNPHGVEALFRRVQAEFSVPPVVLMGCSKDKDISAIAKIVRENAQEIFLTQANSTRAASVELLSSYFDVPVHPFSSLQETIQCAKDARAPLVIFGSFYIMADIREMLGLKYERDEIAVSDR